MQLAKIASVKYNHSKPLSSSPSLMHSPVYEDKKKHGLVRICAIAQKSCER